MAFHKFSNGKVKKPNCPWFFMNGAAFPFAGRNILNNLSSSAGSLLRHQDIGQYAIYAMYAIALLTPDQSAQSGKDSSKLMILTSFPRSPNFWQTLCKMIFSQGNQRTFVVNYCRSYNFKNLMIVRVSPNMKWDALYNAIF